MEVDAEAKERAEVCVFPHLSSCICVKATPTTALGIAAGILLHNPIMKRHVLIFGLVGGILIATLQYTEYRFVIIEHSVELYSALVAILFATFGIWLGLRITRSRENIRETVVVREVLVPAEAPALVECSIPSALTNPKELRRGLYSRGTCVDRRQEHV